MTETEFSVQVARLGAIYGAKHYTGERLKFIWLEVQREKSGVFERAITRLIKSKRATPLVLDIAEAIEMVHASDKQRDRENIPIFPGGFDGILKQAARTTRADKDFVRACLSTLDDFMNKKITKDQFKQACDEIDRVADQINPNGRRPNHPYHNMRNDW